MQHKLSIIIPALNEAAGLSEILPGLAGLYPDAEILVVDDGSTDNTAEVAGRYGATVISHPYTKGNGAAVKTGARAAHGELLLFMDADGQHQADSIAELLRVMDEGYDMVVGARQISAHAGKLRCLGNIFYNYFASRVTGHRIDDLTSGFRLVRAELFREFIYMLPNGFSYPTTITMAFFRSGYSVAYLPVDVRQRNGKSHIRPFLDGMRFLLIIFRIGTLYAPLKLFAPASLLLFVTGSGYYLYTFFTLGRFTNMGMLILVTAFLLFFVGLISEQLTVLLYSSSRSRRD